ncbi:PIR Superfamily Protein [Plasmodium ovale wallikeri]|uniref:PIR Superfamily Protein n=1 Tax=Plasmodium ovale wallikeri TaxID=864142 RepID=A0A1A9AID5_PLAOA|nr:PIR Superfamily Protein [Plasmodium ovale wallikeri]SBT55956.1 PIR Superfamily Protein [Plasmodium ovale wallikeri]
MAPANNDENYNFCNDMDIYITNDAWLKTQWENYEYKNYCIFDEAEFSDKKNEYETICAKFKCLFNLLFDESSAFSSFNEPAKYINFWLNYVLKSIYPSITAQRFYDVVKSDTSFDTHEKLKGKIQNIQDEHLENMTIFYNLYHKYNTIQSLIPDYTSDHTQCESYSKECAQKYEDAIKKCPKGTSSNFCDALNVFKGKYEKLKELITINNCKLEELKPLPSHESPPAIVPSEESQQNDQKELPNLPEEQGDNADFSTATATSGTMLGMFFISLILYKSTPFGPWLRNRILKKNMIGSNTEEEEKNHELLLHMSEYQDINSEDNMYKIPYTSL